ncbi:MAG: peptidoglycan-binding protein [Microthrixaceae bacterium]|nr:peptidoglycan-binding protein [Microthrixaceae bacterium]
MIAVLSVVGLSSCASSPDASSDQASKPSETTAEVVRKDLAQFTDLDGNLELADSRSLVAAATGTIVSLPAEGSTVQRGDTVYLISDEAAASEVAKADADVAASESQLAKSQSDLAKATRGADPGDRASAQAALVSAQRKLDDLLEPPTRAELAAVESKVAAARKALDDLEAGATPADRAAVAQQVAQASATLVSAENADVTTWTTLLVAHADYCDLDTVPVDLCGAAALPWTRFQLDQLNHEIGAALDAGDPDAVVAVTQKLIAAQTASSNAVAAKHSAEAALASAQASEQNKLAPASATSLTKARADLASAEAALDELRAGATPRAVDDARASVDAARAKLGDVLDGATAEERAAAAAAVRSTTASVDLARVQYADLLDSATAPALFYGTEPQVRDIGLGDVGNDVAQVQANLMALGFGDGVSVTSTFDVATQAAVRAWQASRLLRVTGEVRARDIVVMPGPIQIESWANGVEPGGELAVAGPTDLATVTPISAVPAGTPRPDAALSTTQRVIAQLPLEDRAKVEEGATVTVELPDDSSVSATVSVIGSVPVEDKESGDRWVEVTLVPAVAVSEIWIGASVTVKVVDELAAQVLVVPVSSLVSLVEGGYAVYVVDGSTSKLVGVETGMYADGFVEVSGAGLDAGQSVAVPR